MAMTRPNVSQVAQAVAAGADNSITSLNALASINGGQLAGLRNVIYNGQMEISQRGTSQNLTSTYAWGSLDRWAFKQAGTAGQGTASKSSGWLEPHGLRNNVILARNSGSTSTGTLSMGQALELPETLHFRGKQVTLSFWAKRGSTFSAANNYLYAKVTQGHSGYESIVNVGSWATQTVLLEAPVALTTTMARYQITATVENVLAQLGIEFYWTGSGTAGVFDYAEISGVQLELGAVATTFEQRPYGMELALCQRYFHAIGGVSGSPWAISQLSGIGASNAMVVHPITMRASPALAIVGTGFNAQDNSAGPATATISLSTSSPVYSAITYTHAALTANAARSLAFSNATSYLQFSAEL